MHKHEIIQVIPGSIAEELDIQTGDFLLSVNDQEIVDIFDYQFLITDEEITMNIQKPGGEEWELDIEKEEDEDLGLVFAENLMDDYRSCRNNCVFCFIDQMPPGMRETLYFKDDDARLSFLQGNYITLTNLSDDEINRIIRYRMEPINISIHTTNPELRVKMLKNRFAGDVLKNIQKLYDAGIEMNGQIVLCKGLNDGEELQKSIHDLANYFPFLQSLSVVPVGISKYRGGLYPLEPFTKEEAKEVLKTIHEWQRWMYQKHNSHFVHASDEWYILAQEDIPDAANYDEYLQLENGVGMLRLLEDEVREDLDKLKMSSLEEQQSNREEQQSNHEEHQSIIENQFSNQKERISKKITLATGVLAAEKLKELVTEIQQLFPLVSAIVVPIRNDFFGETITVSGLVTGRDLINQLNGLDIGDKLLIPENMLRSGESVFLDDVTVSEVENALQTSVVIVKSSGQDFVSAIIESCE